MPQNTDSSESSSERSVVQFKPIAKPLEFLSTKWFITKIQKFRKEFRGNMNKTIIESYMDIVLTMFIVIKSLVLNYSRGTLGKPSFGDYLSLIFGGILSIISICLPIYVIWKYT